MKKLLGMFLIPFILCSCAQNKWHGGDLTHVTMERAQGAAPILMGVQEAEGQKKIMWDYYGHFNTAGVVAKFAGCDDVTAARIAYFSQAPDNLHRVPQPSLLYNAVPVAFWGAIPPFWGYRQRIEDTLHSLHGGNQFEVKKRQTRLQLRIAGKDINDQSEHWKIGFLIHALGDSYSHVYPSSGGGESAYGPIVGHGLDCGIVKPDYISQHHEHYVEYVKALYLALGGTNRLDQPNKVTEFLDKVKSAASLNKDPEKAEENVKKCIQNEYRYPVISEQEILRNHKKWKEEIHLKNVNAFLKQLADKLAE